MIRALCLLSAGATVDLKWLLSVWPDADADWVTSFWGNKNGPRNTAMNIIAGASPRIKRALWKSTVQQTRIRSLYRLGSRVTIEVLTWAAPKKNPTPDQIVFDSFAALMRAFYERELKRGFALRAGTISYASILHTGMGKSGVCPLCDGKLDPRNRVIDHFYPQESFPVLTCFPDNLIPICDTCNGPRAKLAQPPYTPDASNRVDVKEWFHPRWRTAEREVVAGVIRRWNQLHLTIAARRAAFTPHVQHFVGLTNVDRTWSDRLPAAIRQEQDQVESELRRARCLGAVVDEKAVQRTLAEKIVYYDKRIGIEEYAYRKRGIYHFMANNKACVREILVQINE